jgi:hypothetical protein
MSGTYFDSNLQLGANEEEPCVIRTISKTTGKSTKLAAS